MGENPFLIIAINSLCSGERILRVSSLLESTRYPSILNPTEAIWCCILLHYRYRQLVCVLFVRKGLESDHCLLLDRRGPLHIKKRLACASTLELVLATWHELHLVCLSVSSLQVFASKKCVPLSRELHSLQKTVNNFCKNSCQSLKGKEEKRTMSSFIVLLFLSVITFSVNSFMIRPIDRLQRLRSGSIGDGAAESPADSQHYRSPSFGEGPTLRRLRSLSFGSENAFALSVEQESLSESCDLEPMAETAITTTFAQGTPENDIILTWEPEVAEQIKENMAMRTEDRPYMIAVIGNPGR